MAKTVAVEFPAEIFDVEVNVPLIHQVVVAQQAAARQGTHATKTRAEVRGGGRKPYKQKGTGRARQGSTRAPQFAGGGVVHGPQPRDYSQRTPKKMKAAALRAALSDRARGERIHVVESLVTGDKPSTKTALASLFELTTRRKFLVVLERADSLTWLSLRNAPEVHIVAVDQLNTRDVLVSDDVVFSKAAFERLVAGDEKVAKADAKAPKAPKAAKAETTDAAAPAALADVPEATELPPGAAAPLADGEAPEGYTIKGNADSGKFHAPGGRWYDQTVAEFWFKSAEDAIAAGFVEAGKKAVKADEEGDK